MIIHNKIDIYKKNLDVIKAIDKLWREKIKNYIKILY
jgi:hypothetical protein